MATRQASSPGGMSTPSPWSAGQPYALPANRTSPTLGGVTRISPLKRPLVAHCHLGVGKLYRGTGKREQAHEHLTTAITMYREMDMPFWLEKVETEMREFA
jgi:hypothetical protein